MISRRMEAEVVRDCLLAIAGSLDLTRGGPEIPEAEGQTSPRRSLYFRATPNEKMKFMELFDAADPNACYRRRESVVPQQALALMSSALALDQARLLAARLTRDGGGMADDPASDERFVTAAFEHVLGHPPSAEESAACREFLGEHAKLLQQPVRSPFPGGNPSRQPPAASPRQRARENLVHVLISHNEFITVR